MKKTVLFLLGGLLIISLSQGSDSKAARQNPCAAVSYSHASGCHASGDVANHKALGTPAVFKEVSEPAAAQKMALTSRVLQLMDAFARLVMVI
ncbi:hypothetical protein Q4E40_09755 [Pontibacter sp. BT731]|uniref:hypothetical protein n=1 Tax=Pontibacter coccineus TaxID=3063328 RepID=UPI0026E33631|nr:hypothetical protein [Pontibacter sp. BT731]MDO6390411.1 hypothetical protein [Pontibacter sp. BT731]